jgi:hypothetical protein
MSGCYGSKFMTAERVANQNRCFEAERIDDGENIVA